MAGKSHSCQASDRPSGDQAGSKAQSAPVESRTGQAEPSVGTTAMSQRSSRSTTKATRSPAAVAAGADASPSSDSTRSRPPIGGTATRRPSEAA